MSEYLEIQVPFIKMLESQGWQVPIPSSKLIAMTDKELRVQMRDYVTTLRPNERTPVLTVRLKSQLLKLNSWLTPELADEVIKELLKMKGSTVKNNKRFWRFIAYAGYSIKDPESGKLKTVKFVDWQNSSNNYFEVIPEFFIQGHDDCYLDLQGFINGLPVFTKEDKVFGKYEDALKEILYHYADRHAQQRGCPALFDFSTLLIASDGLTCRMGTVTTPPGRFGVWRDKNKQTEEEEQNTLAKDLLVPETFLNYLKYFILHKEDDTSIIAAYYHQFYATKILIDKTLLPRKVRVAKFSKDGFSLNFKSQGAGKTYDQVFYANYLRQQNERAFKQIYWADRYILSNNLIKDLMAFLPDGKKLIKVAKNGKELQELLKSDGSEVIVSILQKVRTQYDKVSKLYSFVNKSEDIVNIFDEAQRSQMGELKTIVNHTLPNSHQIGHTGTPKDDTLSQFGKPDYALNYLDTIRDGNTVPVLYKGYNIILDEKTAAIDLIEQEKFEEIPQKFKKRIYLENVTPDNLSQAKAVIKASCTTVLSDFRPYLPTPLKCTVRQPSRVLGYLCKKELERQIAADPEYKKLGIKVELVISPEVKKDTTNKYAKKMKPYTDPKRIKAVLYEEFGGKNSFECVDSKIRILVMVDMGSEGYNVPANTGAYNFKRSSMEAYQNAWQYATRGNRAFEYTLNGQVIRKDYCFFVDFVNILPVLNEAIKRYSSDNLEGFDIALTDYPKLRKELKQANSEFEALWKKFNPKKHTPQEFKKLTDSFRTVKKIVHALMPDPEAKKCLDNLKDREKQIAKLRAKKNADGDYAGYNVDYGPKIVKEAQDNVFVKSIDVITNGVLLTDPKYAEALKVIKQATPEEQALAYANSVRRHIEMNKDNDPSGTAKLSAVVDQVLKKMASDVYAVINELKSLIKEIQTLTPEEERLGLTLRSRPLLNAYKEILKIFNEDFNNSREQEFKDFETDLRDLVKSNASINDNPTVRKKKIKDLADEFWDEFKKHQDKEGLLNGKTWKESQELIKVQLNHMVDLIVKGV